MLHSLSESTGAITTPNVPTKMLPAVGARR